MNAVYKAGLLLSLLCSLYLLGCAATREISYQDDVRPVLVDKCVRCHTPPHGEGYRMTGLDMTSYDTLMEGSIYGPVIVPGNSATSPFNMLVEGRAGNLSRILSSQHKAITDHDIRLLQLWVEQGARNQ